MGAGKTAAAGDGWICFVDETGQPLKPPNGRTWARRGHTPVVTVSARRSPRIAIVGMLCVRPGRRPHLFHRLRICHGQAREPKGFTTPDFIRLLTAARHQLDGRLVVVWDNLPAHHARRTRRFIDDHADWLSVYRLPAYTPELNRSRRCGHT